MSFFFNWAFIILEVDSFRSEIYKFQNFPFFIRKKMFWYETFETATKSSKLLFSNSRQSRAERKFILLEWLLVATWPCVSSQGQGQIFFGIFRNFRKFRNFKGRGINFSKKYIVGGQYLKQNGIPPRWGIGNYIKKI